MQLPFVHPHQPHHQLPISALGTIIMADTSFSGCIIYVTLFYQSDWLSGHLTATILECRQHC